MHEGPIGRSGDKVLLVDRKDRRYLVTLAEAGEFHTHAGVVPHADILGRRRGRRVARSNRAPRTSCCDPHSSDFVLKMPRGAQVIYPKDLGRDLAAGRHLPRRPHARGGRRLGRAVHRVAACRCRDHGYELREDFAARAQANVAAFLDEEAMSRYTVEVRDVYEGIDATESSGSCSTSPSPGVWSSTPRRQCARRDPAWPTCRASCKCAAARHARRTARSVWPRRSRCWNARWHVEGQAVRPDHRMVAHTGFLTAARLLHA